MTFDRFFLIFLCVFLLLYGLSAVTSITVVWMPYLIGFSALIAGIIGLIRCFR